MLMHKHCEYHHMPPHVMHGLRHHVGPKPHIMWPHMMPKPHEMWTHMPHAMGHHLMRKPHEMEHHNMHPHMFHKKHHKMHIKHNHKKHRGRSSSSSSSSSSGSEDESHVDGIVREENPGNNSAATTSDGWTCKEKSKNKRSKHLKIKGNHKKGKCKCSVFEKMDRKDFNPQLRSMRGQPCKHSRYNEETLHSQHPESSTNTEEAVGVGTEQQNGYVETSQSEEVTDNDKSKTFDQHSPRQHQTPEDSVDYFMHSIAKQIKRLPEAKITDTMLKILRIVNEMHMDTVVEQSSSAEGRNIENELLQDPQTVTESASASALL